MVFGRAENPEYINRINSPSFAQNLKTSAELERLGINFYLDEEARLIETMQPEEVRRLLRRRAR